MGKEIPDNVVYNAKEDCFDSHTKPYPTSLGSPPFVPLTKGREGSYKAHNFFEGKFAEFKKEYESLLEEYHWTQIIYNADYNFHPLINEPYYLYERTSTTFFLSLIGPTQWTQTYVGTFILLTDGRWKKI